ncbi:meprin A subunit beta-like [Clupea harengus]|uniref:Meprin A subunit beta-like n=1 Tax=Clupea harengus TaxID=7950 RepID=A0A6P8ET57_CLUHA|nr:meprin A subunit beta-like [Clupea harengus]
MESNSRSSISIEGTKWNTSVPYLLGNTLDVHYKGIILRAFEQFGLKSCINFIPRQNENDFIHIQKLEGCFSYVGKKVSGGQNVSIGSGCAIVPIVEHMLLHALGFFHEQSRYDRDDHVTIIWENIQEGKEYEFNKMSENESSLLDTPYDYTSVMHYNKNEFSNGNGSTIITKHPEFQDVIGDSREMSSTDALELNRLYHCDASVSFLDHCSFEDESLCKMSVCSRCSAEWQRVSRADGGPHSDHTHLGTDSQGSFMHFSTKHSSEGDSARLTTRRMTPGRPCQVQCLQFYYYYSGNEKDQLDIWIREFDSEEDTGTRRLMGQISGILVILVMSQVFTLISDSHGYLIHTKFSPAEYWQVHNVPLNATKTFRVEFEARKGPGSSSGGFSVDDINLSETECPHQTWQIRNFEEVLSISKKNSLYGAILYSPRYYSIDGYGYQILLQLRKTVFGVYVRLVSGDYDDTLEWPLTWRQISARIMDQNPHMQLRMSWERSLTPNPTRLSGGSPREEGKLTTVGGETFYASSAWGWRSFMTAEDLQKRDFLKGGDAFFFFTMQDLRPLLEPTNNSLPCATLPLYGSRYALQNSIHHVLTFQSKIFAL